MVINQAEAEAVGQIYRRYLAAGLCVAVQL
jgi:hypothetical protein